MKNVPILLFVLLFSCGSSLKDSKEKTQKDSLPIKEIIKSIKPIFGYRFIITGDFDGDGKKEKLIEHFFSGIDKKETNKFYENVDFDQLLTLTVNKDPISFLISDNKHLDTLRIASGGQLLGLSYMKNEGDLNNDGTDEVSYVVDYADASNLNTCHLVTFKNN